MSLKDFKSREYRMDNVELNYAQNLVKPVKPFDKLQYELQIATADPSTADEWKANHLKVKTEKYINKDGEWFAVKTNGDLKGVKASSIFPSDATEFTKYVVSLKRNAEKNDGNGGRADNGKPNVYEANAERMSEERASNIGNGSIGNVVVYQMYWSRTTGEGITSSLTDIQVAKYVEAPQKSAGFTDLTNGTMPVTAPTFAPVAADQPF